MTLLTLLLATSAAYGQPSQFAFDAPGNLVAQNSETVVLPIIVGQPQNQIVAPGEPASFSVVVADTRGVGYNWFFNGTLVPGANNDTLVFPTVAATNEGSYFVTVSNTLGQFVVSDGANLYIDSDGDGLPDSWEQMFFGGTNQTATGDADGDGVSNLQEFLDGTNPTNKVSALYRVTLLSDGGSVAVVPDQAAYTNGASVTLTATGPEFFHGWTGDLLTRSNSITLTMTNNKTLFAHFGPVTFTWTNALGGDWNTASNWTPNLVPGSNDSVYLTTGNATVTLNANADLADFFLGDGSSPATLTGSGTLTIRGKFTWNWSTLSGGGRTVVETGGSMMILSANPLSLASRTLENGGAATWTGIGNVAMNNAVISNRAGATFDVLGSGSFVLQGGGNRFDNAGTFRKFPAGITSFSGVSFNNYNLAQIQAGTLFLDGGGLNNGTMNVPAGSAMILNSGAFSANASSSINGAGALTVNGASGTLAGLINVSGTNAFANGTITLTGNYICTNNTLAISGGTVNVDGTGSVNPAVLNLIGGTLGGGQTMTVGSLMNWTGGSMSGSGRTVISPRGALAISVPAFSFLTIANRTLENGGTAVWSGSGNLLLNSAVITNRPGALFDAAGSSSMFPSGAARFDNAGTFRKLSPGITSLLTFNNYNQVQIQSGTLSLDGGGLNNGTMDVPVGTSLVLGFGPFSAGAASSIAGAGQLTVNGASGTLGGLINVTGTNAFLNGTVNLTGNYICTNTLTISGGTVNFDGTSIVNPALLSLTGGTLGGGQTVTPGAMLWTAGDMAGSGRTVILPGVTLAVTNSSSVNINSRTLDNGGTTLWSGAGSINLVNGIITNRPGALFETRGSGGLNAGGAPRFDNAGTFRKSINTGTTSMFLTFTNYGTVDIRSGILLAGFGYVSATNASLTCTLGGTLPGTNFGQLQVNGSVTLNGGLNVVLAGGYVPNANDSFAVVTAIARNGAFASFSYPSNQVAMQLSNTPTSVVARVIAVPTTTPPFLLTPVLAGTNVVLTWSAVSNSTYRLEFNPTLAPSNWLGLPGDVLSTGSTASKLDALTSSNRFYRVRVVP